MGDGTASSEARLVTVNDWAHQYAIQLPNGELWCQEIEVPMTHEEIAASADPEDFSISSAERDIMAMFGHGMFGFTGPKPRTKKKSVVVMFERRDDAEKAASQLAEQAKYFGVDWWAGSVVERLCTPFTSVNPGRQFARELSEWLLKQGRTER